MERQTALMATTDGTQGEVIARERKLTARQEAVILELLRWPTNKQAAAAAKVAESTVDRWFRDLAFRQRLEAERRELFRAAKTALRSASLGSVQTLMEVQADPEAKASARVAAALGVLNLCMKVAEQDDILSRLELLEQAHEQH